MKNLNNRILKKHFKQKRLRKPQQWFVVTCAEQSRLCALSHTFLTQPHLKVLLFYIRKILGKQFRKTNFFLRPRYWLTAKAKDSRMGKGKGAHEQLIFPVQSGHTLLKLPRLQQVLFIKLLKSVNVRLPFKARFVRLEIW